MTKLSRIDREALERAVAVTRRDPQRAAQLDVMIAQDGWRYAAEFAAYSCQVDSLRLKPWQFPPCWVGPDDVDAIGDGHRGISRAAALLRRLLDAGLSRWEPASIATLERNEDARHDLQAAVFAH